MKFIKKVLCLFLSTLVLLCSLTPVLANTDITVKIDDKKIIFDVPPQIINDRTMVPLRAIFEALGASVDWDEATETVTSTKDNTTIRLTINNPTMYINETVVTLDSPACLINDRTLVPVRAISEAFGTTVNWNENESTVSIITKKIPIEKITFNNSNDTIAVGETKELSIEIYPHNATTKILNWSSSNKSIVTVNDGKITGIKEGTAKIICKTNDGIKSECKITVTPAPIKATDIGIKINGQYVEPGGTIELVKGQETHLEPVFIPENATANTDLTWKFTGSSENLLFLSDNNVISNNTIAGGRFSAVLPDGKETYFYFHTTLKPIESKTSPEFYLDINSIPIARTLTSVTGAECESSKKKDDLYSLKWLDGYVPSCKAYTYDFDSIDIGGKKFPTVEPFNEHFLKYVDYLENGLGLEKISSQGSSAFSDVSYLYRVNSFYNLQITWHVRAFSEGYFIQIILYSIGNDEFIG